ncbi:MAG: nitroreductase family protein [Oscillospiraceae bacterium]|nr:nitroreductase family protein [Oscillospiraceae bacterium]
MDFYEVVNNRRTVRDFSQKQVPEDSLSRILQAAFKAPTNDHLRQWEIVVLQERESIENALEQVREKAGLQQNALASRPLDDFQRRMYADAVPKQYRMLSQSGCLLLPFYRQNGDLLHPVALQSLNGFASIWCCIEHILLAAAAEGLGCAIRIPVGEEWKFVARQVGAPEGYVMPCYIAVGYPAEDAIRPAQEPLELVRKIHKEKW